MKLMESAEMYLETILVLSRRHPQVRSVDIAHELDYTKPSVSIAMKNLRGSGYVTVDEDGHILLTDAGRAVAETMLERHTLLAQWLMGLGVEESVALRDACRMEHVISPESFAAIKRHAETGKLP